MASQFDLNFVKPTMASSKKAGIKLIRGVIGGFRGSRTPENRVQPVLRCRGSPPPTLAEKFTRNFDRVLNLDRPEGEGFSVIDDEEVCPIDYAEDYRVDDDVKALFCLLKPASSLTHSNNSNETQRFSPSSRPSSTMGFVGTQWGSNERLIKCSKVARVASYGPGSVAKEARQVTGSGVRPQDVFHDTLCSHPTAVDKNQVLCVGHKRPLFQPPPLDSKTFDDEDALEDEEFREESDSWSIVDVESDIDDVGLGFEELVRVCRGSKTVRCSTADKLHGSYPRIHPLCAAKYGDFFKS